VLVIKPKSLRPHIAGSYIHTLSQTDTYLGFPLSCFFVFIRFEVFMAVTMKNAVLWDVTPCGSCKNRVPPKRRFLQEPHGVTSRKTAFFFLFIYLHFAQGVPLLRRGTEWELILWGVHERNYGQCMEWSKEFVNYSLGVLISETFSSRLNITWYESQWMSIITHSWMH
jgi:hypothetical protein